MQKGYFSDTCAIPYENKAKSMRYPLCNTISKRYCTTWEVSRTGPPRLGCCRSSWIIEIAHAKRHGQAASTTGRFLKQILFVFYARHFSLVSKCSATPARIAATPPLELDRVSEVQTTRDTQHGDRGWGATGPFEAGGCSCDSPSTPSKLREEPRRACSYTLERDRGVV